VTETPATSVEVSRGSARQVVGGRSPSAVGVAPAAAGSTTRGAERGARAPSSGRRARATGRARTAGKRQRRRTTRAQAASEDGSADATRLRASADLRHRAAPHDRVCAPDGTRSPAKSTRRIIRPGLVALLLTLALSASGAVAASPVYRIDHVSDGDTVALRNGQRVRLVQIDTPEVFFGRECYARAASARTKTLLPRGTRRVRIFAEPVTESGS
jgi:hypothetical protein